MTNPDDIILDEGYYEDFSRKVEPCDPAYKVPIKDKNKNKF